MSLQAIPGLAVALVDADGTLWEEGFGHVDEPTSAPVTPDTIFSIQSISKMFTATAVMQAVAAGLLDLDEPITTYLPEFTVHSAFEEHPERKITLRMLLSHTAGFTHEAPVGNNNELDPGAFDSHVRSISDTWLRFPAGSGYAYSNLGIDLAGFVLERVERRPFPEIVRDSLLAPLGMRRSTFDRNVIRSIDDRAIGHVQPFREPPLDVPMTAAGGLYTSAADLARFLRFQLDEGSIDGRTLLDPRLMDEMRTVPAPHADAPAGYGLGVVRHRWNRWDQRPDLLEHGGGGFGFLSDLWWLPRIGIGVAVLTNSEDHQVQGELSLSIMADLMREPGLYRDRLVALPNRPPVPDPSLSFEPPANLAGLVADAAMRPSGDEATRWADCVGSFGAPKWGVIDPITPAARFFIEDGVPSFETNEDESITLFRLVEVEPDVFVAGNGETLDFTGPNATWRGLRLVRLSGGPAPWQWAVLAVAAVLSIAWLGSAGVRAVRRVRSQSRSTPESGAKSRWRWVVPAVAGITALLALANLVRIARTPGLVDSGYLGWLDLPLAERLATYLPVALAIAAAAMVVLVAAGWIGRWWSNAVRLQHAALAIAMIAFVVQLAAWRLIG
jgi:CubicO group peptidase (beta-lactamase class C family)